MARALLFGLAAGFPIAAVPGPMFFLVLRRTLQAGWRSGLISGAGIATGDAIYAAIAAFGVTAIISVLLAERRWIGLVGGIAIALIGTHTLISPLPSPPPKGEGGVGKGEGFRDYSSTLALTLGNPPTILSFIAVFAGLGAHLASGWLPALGLVLGVLLGSALWWLILTGVVALLRARISPAVTRAIGILSGLALIAFGLLITLQSL